MSVNDYYRGVEMSTLTADKFVQEYIKRETIEQDHRLYDMKWWDYRAMHPAHATHYFYHLYNEILPEYIAHNFGDARARAYRTRPRPTLKELPLSSIRGFWKARMAADAMGVPYEIYIRCALDSFYQGYNTFATTKRMGHMTPFPNVHLFSKMIVESVHRTWESESAVELQLPQSESVLHQDVWFRPTMERALRAAALKTPYPDHFIEKARRVGAITSPD